jgi:DNA-binding transcriptional ArsR family regulator
MKKALEMPERNIYHHLKILEMKELIKIKNTIERGCSKKTNFPINR